MPADVLERRPIRDRLRSGGRVRLTELIAAGAEWDERDLPLGRMEPTHELVPECLFSHGQEAVNLAQVCGYDLYQFQREGLIAKLGVNAVELRDGSIVERWAAQETADVISRRNGKSVEIEVLILFGLFFLDEMQIMYTAHRDDTAKAVFDNVRTAIERTPELRKMMPKNGFRVANGQRSITLRSGAVCYFRTRTNESARGQGFNRLILDEAQHLTEIQMAAVMPVVTGAVNAQINYAGSAGDLEATVLAKVWRSFERQERGLCYRGWHADPESDFDDLALIARMNPRLGHGLSYEFVAKEFGRMTRAQFGRERCGAATYPRTEGAGWVIPEEAWTRAKDPSSQIADGELVRVVLEADPELKRGTIAAGARRADRAMHVEVLRHLDGVVWMVEAARQLHEQGAEVWVDPGGPCAFMIGDLHQAGVPVKQFKTDDVTSAWSWFYTAANPPRDASDPQAPPPPPTVRHRDQQLLTLALAAAETRKVRERLTLRRVATGDVNQGPVIGVMLAGYAAVKGDRVKPPPSPEVLEQDHTSHELPGGDLTSVQF